MSNATHERHDPRSPSAIRLVAALATLVILQHRAARTPGPRPMWTPTRVARCGRLAPCGRHRRLWAEASRARELACRAVTALTPPAPRSIGGGASRGVEAAEMQAVVLTTATLDPRRLHDPGHGERRLPRPRPHFPAHDDRRVQTIHQERRGKTGRAKNQSIREYVAGAASRDGLSLARIEISEAARARPFLPSRAPILSSHGNPLPMG